MFSQNGLSLDQAPPISVIFRFFLSGALFGILGGMLMLIFQYEIFDASSLSAVILTHTLTLGVMLSFMFAALFQMLPVIAGVTLQNPVKKANILQYPFVLGVIVLLLAFHYSYGWLFILASLLLGGSLLAIIIIMLINLLRLQHHTYSSKGMLIALLSLLITVLLALYLTLTLSGQIPGTHYHDIKMAHYSFGLFGWIGILIISISFQVIEMFYVTPAYPKLISSYIAYKLFALLFAGLIIAWYIPTVWVIIDIFLALVLSGYALFTLRRLSQRKRPLTDATVWFWRLGLITLITSMLLMLTSHWIETGTIKPLSYIFFASFALSIVFAMFYKIVPFLTWFHLNAQGYFTAPMMHEVIHPKTAMKHLYIHLTTVITLVLSVFIPPLLYLAGLLTVLSFSWMVWQILHAWKLYRYTQTTGERFDMGEIEIPMEDSVSTPK